MVPVLDTSSADNPLQEEEEGHSGYSHAHHSSSHSATAHHAVHDHPSSSQGPQLSAHALRAKLLATLSPTAAAEAAAGHRDVASPRETTTLRSTSAPDLTRQHGQGSAPSPAALEDDEWTEKMRRTNSFVAASRDHSATRGEGTAGLGGHVTPVNLVPAGDGNGPNRPPLLSKKLLEPKKRLGKNPTFKTCLKNVVKYSWLNVLLVFVPVSWAMDLSHQSATITFVFSFLAIIPCAAQLGFATEELALRVGDALGGLLNATFGNAVELIISILALVKGELDIVRSAMLGSILSNCLLVLGGCFFAGGIRYFEQPYSTRAAQLNINLLGIAIIALVTPVGFHHFIGAEALATEAIANDSVLRLSRGISFILLIVYACYLLFQLWTHSYLYVPAPPRDPRAPLPTSTAALLLYADGPQPPTEGRVFRIPSWGSSTTSNSSASTRSVHSVSLVRTRSRASSVGAAAGQRDLGAEEEGHLPTHGQAHGEESVVFHATEAQAEQLENGSVHPAVAIGDLEKGAVHEGAAVEHEEPQLSPVFALGWLVVITVLTGVTAEFLVGSIDGLTQTGNVSREFVAFILLPVVGNAAEHVTAITVATKNKLDLSLAVAVGSSIQVALFVIPILVLLAWCIGQPLDMLFDPFETLVVFLGIASVNWAIADGRTQWMEGLSLMMAYVVIALTSWYYPGQQIQV
ncbi:hypothetical protein JCM11251_006508 [Rhodosporidiobolus azoricus]